MMWLKLNQDGSPSVEGKTKTKPLSHRSVLRVAALIHKVMEYGKAMGLEMIQVTTKTPRGFPSLGSNRFDSNALIRARGYLDMRVCGRAPSGSQARREVVRSISEGTGVTPPHRKFDVPVPDQTKPGVTLPDSGDSQTRVRIRREPPAKLRGDQ
jgi:hypothetical protein